jgi:hypothetical protein
MTATAIEAEMHKGRAQIARLQRRPRETILRARLTALWALKLNLQAQQVRCDE